MSALLILLLACAQQPQPTECGKVSSPSPAQTPDGAEPDFTNYGFGTVSGRVLYSPGVAATIATSQLEVQLPGNLYSEPLEFELLVDTEGKWQSCFREDEVIAPYAFRVTNPATRQRVGRFDTPARVIIRDNRVNEKARYWITTPDSPSTATASTTPLNRDGTAIQVENGSARRGWFVTVPKR